MGKSKDIDFHFTKNYVYYHVDPRNNHIVYVGMGTGGRAWCCSPSDHYDPDHSKWIKELLEIGYTPDEWVQVIRSRLDRSEALLVEVRMIKRWKPKFNRLGLAIYTMLTEDQQFQIIKAREAGNSYHQIAKVIGKSAMTIQRFYTQYQSGKGLERSHD